MGCNWSNTDCQNIDIKCHLCSSKDFHYKPTKIKQKKTKMKDSKRQGSAFEVRNHNNVQDVLVRPTPNSGAGSVKGDEEIKGIIEIMEELKCSNKTTARGAKTFTLHKEWLKKLDREAKEANKEFWYLKFAFGDHDEETFVAIDSVIIMSMVKTMVEDRKALKKVQNRNDVIEKTIRAKETEVIALESKIELLEAKIRLLTEEGEEFEF